MNIEELRKVVKTKEDLMKICKENNYNCDPFELDELYNDLTNPQVLDDTELEATNGGKKIPACDLKNHTVVKYYCKYCNQLVWFPLGISYTCPACGRMQAYDKSRRKKGC